MPPLEGIDDDLMTTIYEEMAIAEEMKENEEKDDLSQLSSFWYGLRNILEYGVF